MDNADMDNADMDNDVDEPKPVVIDNAVFKLHYRVTTRLMVSLALVVGVLKYIFYPIDCDPFGSSISADVTNKFCLFSACFPKVLYSNLTVPKSSGYYEYSNTLHIYHRSYSWICLMLIIQACAFYVPHALWKVLEGDRIKCLVAMSGLPTSGQGRSDCVVKYFRDSHLQHRTYLMFYVMCELLNFANVIAQVYFTSRYLGSAAMGHGIHVVPYLESADNTAPSDPMTFLYPEAVSCVLNAYNMYGRSNKHVAICGLPINYNLRLLHDLLWIYLVVLSAISLFGLLHRLTTMFNSVDRLGLLNSRRETSSQECLDLFVTKFSAGDWFVLKKLSKSVDSDTFIRFATNLAKEFNVVTETTPLLDL